MTSLCLFFSVFLKHVISADDAYDMEKTLSTGAQLSTLSFDCLSFITGNTCADSFIPPGKVADFFGFQFLRDNTADGQGHNTNFLTFAVNNLISILSDEQIQTIRDASMSDIDLVDQYAFDRYPLLIALREQLEGTHEGYTLNQTAILQYSKELYLLDANISISRAYLFSQIVKSLNVSQTTYLDSMVAGGFASWSAIYETPKLDKRGMNNNQYTLFMTYCSEMFGWYAGNITSDTYFAPERQANYFGSFFAKDAPAVGTNNYTISESITNDKGTYLLQNILNTSQRSKLQNLVNIQWNDLYGISIVRKNISDELRLYLSEGNDEIDSIDIDKVFALAGDYGMYDGNISYHYTMAFQYVYDMVNSTQQTEMGQLRNLSDYPCDEAKIFQYSTKIDIPNGIRDTMFLFMEEEEDTDMATQEPIRSVTQEPAVAIVQYQTAPERCVFPFSYKSVTYYGCTDADHSKPWCAFDNVYADPGMGSQRRWANCPIIAPSVGNKLADITIRDEMRISFTMKVTGVPSANVVNVMQIGTDDGLKRAPAVHIFETNRLRVELSNNANWNNVFTYNNGINNGGTYTFVITYTQSKWEVRINNQQIMYIDNSFGQHTTGTSLPLYASCLPGSWRDYPAAPVKITNLKIEGGSTGSFAISEIGPPVFDVPEYNGFEISDWFVYTLAVLLCVFCVVLTYANCKRFRRKPKYKSVATVHSSEDDMHNLVEYQI